MQNTFLRHQLQPLWKQAIGLNKKLWREQTVWQKVTKGGAWTLTPESNSVTISGNMKLAVVTEHGVETQDRLSSLLLKGTEKLRFPWTHQRKPACVWTVCSLAANGLFGIFAQGSALQVRRKGGGGITKWGKHDRCLKLGFTVPMRKQVHITRLGENDFCWPPQLSLIQANSLPTQHPCQTGKDGDSSKVTCTATAFPRQGCAQELGHQESSCLPSPARQPSVTWLSWTFYQRKAISDQLTEPGDTAKSKRAVSLQFGTRVGKTGTAWVWNPSLSLFFLSFPFFFLFSFSTTDTDYEDI